MEGVLVDVGVSWPTAGSSNTGALHLVRPHTKTCLLHVVYSISGTFGFIWDMLSGRHECALSCTVVQVVLTLMVYRTVAALISSGPTGNSAVQCSAGDR